MTAESDVHLPAGRGVLDRIGDEVEKELTQSRAIAHHNGISREWKIDRDALCFAENEGSLINLLHQRLQLHRLAMQIEPALVCARECQQTLYEIGHPAHFLERLFERDHSLGLR